MHIIDKDACFRMNAEWGVPRDIENDLKRHRFAPVNHRGFRVRDAGIDRSNHDRARVSGISRSWMYPCIHVSLVPPDPTCPNAKAKHSFRYREDVDSQVLSRSYDAGIQLLLTGGDDLIRK